MEFVNGAVWTIMVLVVGGGVITGLVVPEKVFRPSTAPEAASSKISTEIPSVVDRLPVAAAEDEHEEDDRDDDRSGHGGKRHRDRNDKDR